MITDRGRETGLDATLQATFGGGCFWCLHAVFEQVEGVAEVRSGYCGGALPDPDYAAVCSGTTGHIEVKAGTTYDVQIIARRDTYPAAGLVINCDGDTATTAKFVFLFLAVLAVSPW